MSATAIDNQTPTESVTMRDWRAMKCMEGLLASEGSNLVAGVVTASQLAALAYSCADALETASIGVWDSSTWDTAKWD